MSPYYTNYMTYKKHTFIPRTEKQLKNIKELQEYLAEIDESLSKRINKLIDKEVKRIRRFYQC